MKKKTLGYFVFAVLFLKSAVSFSQKGPAGVGENDGSSTLKAWYRTDNGLITSGTTVDSIRNSSGVRPLSIGEVGTLRPTIVLGAVNGYDEISFNGTNRLRTDLNLTTSNFVTDQATTFVVSRADNTTQTSCVYTTDPLVGTTRFSNHIPWSGTVYYDIGTCCGAGARIYVGGLTGLTNYSVWAYDVNPTSGKQLYRNGSLLRSIAGSSLYTNHSTQRFNIGGYTSGVNGFVGDVTEVIVFNSKINSAQRTIIDNYLSAKYGLTLAIQDMYDEDNVANGNYDHDVAGIGRIDAANIHNSAQGTGSVRISNPSDLNNNEFLFWGHNNGIMQATETADIPSSVEARFDRTWRVSEVNTSNSAVDVGAVDISFDLTGLGPVTASDLRLLVDTNNDGFFADELPISGASDLGSNVFGFSGINLLQNNLRFTLSTINRFVTPLPVVLIDFEAKIKSINEVTISWSTASERDNNYFSVQKSNDGIEWFEFKKIYGKGNSEFLVNYNTTDSKPFIGISYYRLEQIDVSGISTFSDIKIVNNHMAVDYEIELYPNPAKNKIIVRGIKLKKSEIQVFNILGTNITHLLKISQHKNNEIEISIKNIENGTYYLKSEKNKLIFQKSD